MAFGRTSQLVSFFTFSVILLVLPLTYVVIFFSPYSASSPIRKLVELREGTDMGVSQNLNSEANDSFYIPRDKIEATILNARKYLEDEVIGKMSKDTIKLCKNEHTDCALWAAAGECDVNPKCKLRNWGQMGYAD